MNLVVSSNVANTTEAVDTLWTVVADHLAREGDIDDQSSHLEIVVEQLQLSEGGDMNCRIRVTGNLNGVNVSESFSAQQSFGETDGARLVRKTASFGVVGLLTEVLIPPPKVEFKLTPFMARKLNALFNECTNDLLIHLDSKLGRKGNAANDRWQFFQKLKVIGVIVVLIAYFVGRFLSITDHDRKEPIVSLVLTIALGAIAASFGGLTIHWLGFLFMPSSYFVTDPRGRKAIASVGVKSTLAMRSFSAVCVLLFGSICIACGSLGTLFGVK